MSTIKELRKVYLESDLACVEAHQVYRDAYKAYRAAHKANVAKRNAYFEARVARDALAEKKGGAE